VGQRYDLEERTFRFADQTKTFLKTLPLSPEKDVYGKQLLRSSASVGANYIEANESLTRREKHHRMGICRKEAKESWYFFRLLHDSGGEENARARLEQEAKELTLIFGAILQKI